MWKSEGNRPSLAVQSKNHVPAALHGAEIKIMPPGLRPAVFQQALLALQGEEIAVPPPPLYWAYLKSANPRRSHTGCASVSARWTAREFWAVAGRGIAVHPADPAVFRQIKNNREG